MKFNNGALAPPPKVRCALICFVLLALAALPAEVLAHPGPHDGSHGHDHGHDDLGAEAIAPASDFSPTAGAISLSVIADNQQSLAEVFSQESIRNAPTNPFDSGIRVDFNDVIEVDRPDLLSIDTQQEQQAIFNLFGNGIASPASDTLNIYYVDDIRACGETINANIVGCASVNGNDLIVESSFAAGVEGAELLAHEIGHNLGLPHVGNNNSRGNLLNPVLNGSTALTDAQALSLLSNRRVNRDFTTDELFITINPIVIGGLTAVPEPGAFAFAALGLLAFSRRGRRRG